MAFDRFRASDRAASRAPDDPVWRAHRFEGIRPGCLSAVGAGGAILSACPSDRPSRCAAAPSPAVLTLALVVYSALILASVAVAVHQSRRRRRGRAIAAAAVVGVLTVLGLVLAILSSV